MVYGPRGSGFDVTHRKFKEDMVDHSRYKVQGTRGETDRRPTAEEEAEEKATYPSPPPIT